MTSESPAARLPERPPNIGELVQVRSRRWLVEDVIATDPGESPRVELACADDDAQGQTLTVFWDYEIDRRILEDEGWADLASKGFDSPRWFAAFFRTLRWSCSTATDPGLFQAPFRAGITIDAYQMEPLRKALRLPRVNLFVADDTGLLRSRPPQSGRTAPRCDLGLNHFRCEPRPRRLRSSQPSTRSLRATSR